jgi:hypothetical protein
MVPDEPFKVPMFTLRAGDLAYTVALVHPMWRYTAENKVLFDSIEDPTRLVLLDTFNGLRRPSWCVEKIIQELIHLS